MVTQTLDAGTAAAPTGRKRLWAAVRLTLTALVLGFVVWQAVDLWRSTPDAKIELSAGWLVAAGAFYATAWLPSVWLYKALLDRMGDRVGWAAVARAYYVGHLGKYVPGKALVVLIRGQMIQAAGGRFRAAALAVLYETVVLMAAGVYVGVALAGFLLPDDPAKASDTLRPLLEWGVVRPLVARPALLPLVVLVWVVATLPFASRAFAFLADKAAPAQADAALERRIDWRLIGAGLLGFVPAWGLQGAALWAVLRGTGAAVGPSELLACAAAAGLATAAGFIVMIAPGGLGVRELVLIEALRLLPGVSPPQAAAAAFLMRAVTLVAEVVMAVAAYYGLRPASGRRQPAKPNIKNAATSREADAACSSAA